MKTEIENFDPCGDAVIFRNQYSSFEEAWNACPRGDWMLWLAFRLDVDKRTLTLAKAKCAETVIHLMKDERSINAVKVALRYGNGNATDKELAAAYAAKRKNQMKTAEICREVLTEQVLELIKI